MSDADSTAAASDRADAPATTAPGGFRDRYAVLLLLAALALIHVGLWRASGYLGDVGVFVAKADALNRAGQVTANLYLTVHQACLLLAPYPLDAHNLVRLIASAMSVFGLYGLLRASRLCRPFGALAASILWIATILCVPYAQIALSNLFAYALCLCGLAGLTGGFTWRRWLVALATAYLAAKCRPEYLGVLAALLAIAGLHLAVAVWRARREQTAAAALAPRRADWLAAGVVSLLMLTCSALPKADADSAGADAYLLLGFHQSYALYHNRNHGADAFINPWLESMPLTAREFGDPQGLSDVIRHEPGKFVDYIWDNSRHNLPFVLPAIMQTRSPPGGSRIGLGMIQMGKLLAGATVLAAIAAVVLALRRRRPGLRELAGLLLDLRVQVLASLLIAAGLPLLMYGRESRLYVSLVPLAFLPLAWALGRLLSLPRPRWAWLACGLLALAMCRPLFPGRPSNRPLIDELRRRGLTLQEPVTIGGPNSRELGGLALGAGQEGYTNLDQHLVDTMQDGGYDFVVFSHGLGRSSLFRQHREFFSTFLARPELFGYGHVITNEADDEYLILFQRNPIQTESP